MSRWLRHPTSWNLMAWVRCLTADSLAVPSLTIDRRRRWGYRRDGRGNALIRTGPRGSLRPEPQRLEDRGHFRPIQGLLLEQRAHQIIEDIPILGKDVERLLVGVADQLGDLLVDDRSDLFGVVATVTDVPAQEGFGVTGTELDRARAVRSSRTESPWRGRPRWPSRCRYLRL